MFFDLVSGGALLSFIFYALSQSLLVLSQQLDPIKNICSRWDHQSAILDGTLYIEGGVQVFVDISPTNGTKLLGTQHVGTNKNLLALDMTQSWNWWNGMPFKIQDGQESIQSTLPPPLISGVLWPYKKSLYLYGGTTSRLNDSFTGYTAPTTDDIVMWKYDVEKTGWSPVELKKSENNTIPRLSSGASAVAPDQGLAFHYGGEIDNGTLPVAESNITGVSFISSFYAFNFTDESTLALSTNGLGNTTFRANSQMVHIPGIGGKGILALMGGGFKNSSVDDMDWRGELLSMGNIAIFDIASTGTGGTWYNQTATGDIPSPRIDFCIAVVSAPDNSSHNIFLYGGWNGAKNFDDIYVLSLPSFRWIKIFQGKDERRSHSCHVVGNRQLMTIGGRRGEKLPGECDWQPNTISLFDMVVLDWVPAYNPNGTEWHVPKTISSIIGGGTTGGATLTAPENWTPGLQKVFNPESASSPSPTSTSTPQTTTSTTPDTAHKPLSKSVIIGVSIGLAIFLLLLLYTIHRLIRASKLNRMNRFSRAPPAELDNTVSLGAFQELLGSLGKPKPGRPTVELEASHPPYLRVRDSSGSPYEVPYDGEYDTNSLAAATVVEKPEGNWI